MAVQPWELAEEHARPRLVLVQESASPPRGRPFLAVLFVIFIALAVGLPSIASALQADAEIPRWVPRPRPAAAIAALDRIDPIPRTGRPASREPFAGMLFVRCTRLWSALPDGSHARKVLEMPGISSPAIAPNARSVAFFVDDPNGQELWMAGVRGEDPTRVGRLSEDGRPVLARATGLSWSPRGDQLAFALVDGRYGEFEGGAAIWKLDLSDGRFQRLGSGWPAPFWVEGKVTWSQMTDKGWPQLTSPSNARGWLVRNLRTSKHDLAGAVVPDGYSDTYRSGAAVFRVAGDRPVLIVKHLWRRDVRAGDVVAPPPPGYSFEEHARPSIAQDGSSVSIGLIDRAGERDLGVLDTESERWTVLDYAWDSTSSPAPTISGRLGARDAVVIVSDLLSSWSRAGTRRNLLVEQTDRGAFPFAPRTTGFVAGEAVRVGGVWHVPVSVYGERDNGDPAQMWQGATVAVDSERRRVVADVRELTPMQPLATVADAVRFVETALGREIAAPPLPSDTELRSSSLYAWSYNGSSQISFQAPASVETERGLKRRNMGFGYGDDLDFSLGCGGEVDPQPVDLNGVPGMVDSSRPTHQVIWPATPDGRSGTHSVHGNWVPKEAVIEMAERMASATP